MQDDSITIKLFRNGLENGPEYKVTVYDSGRVIYEGINNVKIKDTIETSIIEEKVVALLESLKESGIFNINQNYSISENSGRPFTRLTVEMPGGTGGMKKKSVVHYDDDSMIPHSLKSFEDKIDELVESYRWVKVPKPEKKSESVSVKSSHDFGKTINNNPIKEFKKNKRNIKLILPALIGIIIILCLVFFLFMNPYNGTNDDEAPDIFYDPPEISSLTAASPIFGTDDTISINFEYGNVTHDNTSEFSGLINLYNGQNLVDIYSFEVSSSEDFVEDYAFEPNASWPLGEYTVVFELKDEISGLSTDLETSFTLYEKVPKIIKLTSASSVTAYKEYTADSLFELNETVYIYLEYSGINTTNDNTVCDIRVIANVTASNKEYYSSTVNKTTVGNKAQMWWFELDPANWDDSKIYKINIELYDLKTNLSTSESTSFYVS